MNTFLLKLRIIHVECRHTTQDQAPFYTNVWLRGRRREFLRHIAQYVCNCVSKLLFHFHHQHTHHHQYARGVAIRACGKRRKTSFPPSSRRPREHTSFLRTFSEICCRFSIFPFRLVVHSSYCIARLVFRRGASATLHTCAVHTHRHTLMAVLCCQASPSARPKKHARPVLCVCIYSVQRARFSAHTSRKYMFCVLCVRACVLVCNKYVGLWSTRSEDS